MARVNCRGRCTHYLTFHDSCGALAAGAGTGCGWGNHETRAQAEQIALAEYTQRTRSCAIRVWGCTSR